MTDKLVEDSSKFCGKHFEGTLCGEINVFDVYEFTDSSNYTKHFILEDKNGNVLLDCFAVNPKSSGMSFGKIMSIHDLKH